MNTTAKGDQLETQIYSSISQLISDDKFFAKSECCRIFRKKGYYSKDRSKEIIFDIAVEIFLPGQDAHSLLILIECKNYEHRVPVDDVEEFYAKVQQISPANTKAIVASTNSFQEGAFNFAKSKGIGLLRYFSRDTLEWVLTRSPANLASTNIVRQSWSKNDCLLSQTFKSRHFDFYCFLEGDHTNSLTHLCALLARSGASSELHDSLDEIEQHFSPKTRLVPYMEQSEIEFRCRALREATGYAGGPVSLGGIIGLYADRGLQVKRTTLEPGILGTISFDPLVIEIDESQAGDANRARFTLAHEVGHLHLGHDKYLIKDVCRDSDVEIESPPQIEIKDIGRMEWQANYFASCLLLPTELLASAIRTEARALGVFDRGHGLIYLDEQRCNIEIFYSLTTPIMRQFNVSRSVVKVRLEQLGFLTQAIDEISTTRTLLT